MTSGEGTAEKAARGSSVGHAHELELLGRLLRRLTSTKSCKGWEGQEEEEEAGDGEEGGEVSHE